MGETAAPASGARAYWNGRPDPLDWTGAGRERDASWQKAFDVFLAPATRDALAALGDLRGRRVLEVACAQGYGSLHLCRRGARVVGIDLSDARCRDARAKVTSDAGATEARFLAADARGLPFDDASFDAVFCRDVLMYADPTAVVRECRRVVAAGGDVVFVESLVGHPLVRLWRRTVEPADYRQMTRHLDWSEFGRIGGDLERRSLEPYYLLSTAAFAWLFLGGSSRVHLRLLGLCAAVDRMSFACVPALRRWAWRGVAHFRRPSPDGR